MGDYDLQSITDIIRSSYPSKTIIEISEYENEEHQTYKFLYEKQSKLVEEQTEELYELGFKNQDLEREISEIKKELGKQKSINLKMNSMTTNIMEFIEHFTEQEIIVSDIKAVNLDGSENVVSSDTRSSLLNTISDKPGVYGEKRPSWFTPLQTELSKENVSKRAVSNTKHIFKERLLSWKKISRLIKSKKISVSEAASEIDFERKNKIIKLLKLECSNYEKYLRYFLLTPGLSQDYMYTLTGAAELGLDANVIIELLEQPQNSFNAEIIETYVSEVHKGTECNLKRELAHELVRGDWYVTAQVNGQLQKFQMVPIELLIDLKEKLNNICDILSKMADEEVCSDTVQTSSDVHQNEKNFIDYYSEDEFPSLYEFDDSMI